MCRRILFHWECVPTGHCMSHDVRGTSFLRGPERRKGDGNLHAHIMLTMRGIKPDGIWAQKEKKIYALDEEGNRIPFIDPAPVFLYEFLRSLHCPQITLYIKTLSSQIVFCIFLFIIYSSSKILFCFYFTNELSHTVSPES